jgi:hypothetical protein
LVIPHLNPLPSSREKRNRPCIIGQLFAILLRFRMIDRDG